MRQYHRTGVSVQYMHRIPIRRPEVSLVLLGSCAWSQCCRVRQYGECRARATCLEFADETNLHLQLIACLAPHFALGKLREIENIAGCRATHVDQKIGVEW